jgi:uncharacterized coiled-coil protein SlyX
MQPFTHYSEIETHANSDKTDENVTALTTKIEEVVVQIQALETETKANSDDTDGNVTALTTKMATATAATAAADEAITLLKTTVAAQAAVIEKLEAKLDALAGRIDQRCYAKSVAAAADDEGATKKNEDNGATTMTTTRRTLTAVAAAAATATDENGTACPVAVGGGDAATTPLAWMRAHVVIVVSVALGLVALVAIAIVLRMRARARWRGIDSKSQLAKALTSQKAAKPTEEYQYMHEQGVEMHSSNDAAANAAMYEL